MPDQEPPCPDDLRGRCAVVTGAANGIGRAIALELWRAGADVVAVDTDGQALKDHFGNEHTAEHCAWVEHDFALPDDQFGTTTNGEALADKLLATAGERRFDLPTLIVNNVGIESDHGFLGLPADDFDRIQRVNLRTPWHLTRRLVQELLRSGTGAPAAILFISSPHATVPSHRPHHSASKAAVASLTRELATTLGKYRIRVNAISPGWVRTDPDPTSPEQQAKEETLVPRIPLGRRGHPEEVARLASALLSDDYSGYVTGADIPVDGGFSLGTWVPPRGVTWDDWRLGNCAHVSRREQPAVGLSRGELKGRCAVVTGAARGIGLAMVHHLRDAGADVIAVDKDEHGLKEHFDGTSGCQWIAHDLALSDEHFSERSNGDALAQKVLAMATERKAAIPSLIVNNAADSTPSGFLEMEPDDHDSVYRVIERTPWYLTQRLVKESLRTRTGHPETPPERVAVLFISSIHKKVPARRPHYSASKAALEQLVRETAFELGGEGIRVNLISPGWIRTDPDPDSPEQQAKERMLVPGIPLGRPGTPEDVARTALLLLSEHYAGYVTGADIPVDGGLALGM